MINNFKISLGNIAQFSIFLLQVLGLFLVKPKISNYNNGSLFSGGNIYNFILIFISIALMFLSYSYTQKKYAIKWFVTFIIGGLIFIISFFYYDSLIDRKTIVYSSNGENLIRFVKGNNFSQPIKNCAESLKKSDSNITDEEIIKNCADIIDYEQLNKVWPEKEIKENLKVINIWYCALISIACIVLICGVQALKCKKIQIE